jgi:endonuclease YncB( thermonuclease family)
VGIRRAIRWTATAATFVAVLAAATVMPAGTPVADAHQSGCHTWHSCPSDTGSYVCGDLGYDTYCPGTTNPDPGTTTTAPADKDCADFASQAAAQAYFESRGGPSFDPDGLDADHDGVACQDNPGPYAGPDADYDGTPDFRDECPAVTASTPDGCPPPDADNDGTPNPSDACPTKAGYTTNGCPDPKVIRAWIVAVVDGDTIKVRKGKRRFTVRLIGIDTPETKKPGTAVECGGPEATANLEKLSFRRNGDGRRVTLTTDPTQDRTDKYGRMLAHAKVDTGKVLQVHQLRAGWATLYVFDSREFLRFTPFREAVLSAWSADRGVWGKCAGDFHST